MSSSLAPLPEELLASILALALDFPHRHPTALLLVSRQFFRIASPLFYHSLHLRSPRQAARVLDTLSQHPILADIVRRIVFAGIWSNSADVLALCDRVSDIDISLDAGPSHRVSGPDDDPNDPDAQAFCTALEQCRTITHLTIRKEPAVYLTLPRSTHVFHRLAHAVHYWPSLETVHFALRVSASPATLSLARALSVAPCLRCVRAQLPAVWNNVLLVISTNPHLERVILYTEPILGPISSRQNHTMAPAVIKGICDDIEHAILGTGLYMMEAGKHARFSELVKSGTSIIRTRAHTTIATLSASSASGTSLGPIRAKEVAVGLMASNNRDNFGVPLIQPLPTSAGRHLH